MFRPIEIFWEDKLVGTLVNSVPDMWCLEGEFISHSSEIAKNFVNLAEELDPKLVFKNWDDGMVIKLKEFSSSSSFGVVQYLSESSLFLRSINAKENIGVAGFRYDCLTCDR